MEAFLAEIATKKYLVVFPDMTTKLYNSLRDVGADISVSAPTLSRRLKEADGAFFIAPVTSYVFWVSKWDNQALSS